MEVIGLLLIVWFEFGWKYVTALCAGYGAIWGLVRLIRTRKRRREHRVINRILNFRKESANGIDLDPFLQVLEDGKGREADYREMCARYRRHRAALRKEAAAINRKAEKTGLTIRIRKPI